MRSAIFVCTFYNKSLKVRNKLVNLLIAAHPTDHLIFTTRYHELDYINFNFFILLAANASPVSHWRIEGNLYERGEITWAGLMGIAF
jgi:hypothetical protein